MTAPIPNLSAELIHLLLEAGLYLENSAVETIPPMQPYVSTSYCTSFVCVDNAEFAGGMAENTVRLAGVRTALSQAASPASPWHCNPPPSSMAPSPLVAGKRSSPVNKSSYSESPENHHVNSGHSRATSSYLQTTIGAFFVSQTDRVAHHRCVVHSMGHRIHSGALHFLDIDPGIVTAHLQ